MQFSSPTAGLQSYGAGNGFTWQPRSSNADARASAFGKATAWRDALQSQGDAFNTASNAATSFGMAQMAMDSQERIAKMQADAAAKAKRSSGGGVGGILGGLGSVASLIPGVGPAIGAGLGVAGKMFG